MAADQAGGWRREEDKAFEDALAAALPFEEGEGREREMMMLWEEIAAKVPGGRTAAEVRHHYETLVEDVRAIEAGKVPFPCYQLDKEKDRQREGQTAAQDGVIKKGVVVCGALDSSGGGHHVIRSTSTSKAEQERRKGIPWTEEEHKLFLLGLDKYGKGDWRSISRNFVVSRTPTQVASHAQKYFIRLNAMNRDRRRASIHDITSVHNGDATNSNITGQMNPAAARTAVHPQPAMPAVAMYRAALGQPAAAAGHAVSAAVGTPVLRPPVGHPPYIIPVAYPVLPSTMHP